MLTQAEAFLHQLALQYRKILFLSLIILVGSVQTALAENYHSHPSDEAWEEVEPYLLPEDHPIKPILDDIFSDSKILLSLNHMRKGGFNNPKIRKWSHVVVTSHSELPGYIFKIYLHSQRHFKGMKEYGHWVKRIIGARSIQEMLDEKGWNDSFKCPKKWIYYIESKAPKGYPSKHFILVEEDMQLVDEEENRKCWKSDWITEKKLTDLYYILETIGLLDCAKIHNIPFSVDGKIAFIDTETWESWPVTYFHLTPDLPGHLHEFWENLYKDKKDDDSIEIQL